MALNHADPENHAFNQDEGYRQGRLGKTGYDIAEVHDAVLLRRGELIRWALQ